jgi:hypothetical protein
MQTIMYGPHKIEIKEESITGVEKVFYDGREVSSKRSMLGTTHVFSVHEDGQNVQYEVEIGVKTVFFMPRPYTTVRRNGVLIFSNR